MKLDYSDEYGRAFGDLVESKSSVRLFPNDHIDAWLGRIQDIEDGYVGIHPELSLELQHVRAPLDYILSDDKLSTYPEHQALQKIIGDLDERYCTLTQLHPRWSESDEPWWAKRILKYGRQEYADFMYGTDLSKAEIQIITIAWRCPQQRFGTSWADKQGMNTLSLLSSAAPVQGDESQTPLPAPSRLTLNLIRLYPKLFPKNKNAS